MFLFSEDLFVSHYEWFVNKIHFVVESGPDFIFTWYSPRPFAEFYRVLEEVVANITLYAMPGCYRILDVLVRLVFAPVLEILNHISGHFSHHTTEERVFFKSI